MDVLKKLDNGNAQATTLLCQAKVLKGQEHLRTAQEHLREDGWDGHWLSYAITELEFAHDNGNAQATTLLCQAKVLKGQEHLRTAQERLRQDGNDGNWLDYAIKELEFAHANGNAQATTLLCQAKALKGQE